MHQIQRAKDLKDLKEPYQKYSRSKRVLHIRMHQIQMYQSVPGSLTGLLVIAAISFRMLVLWLVCYWFSGSYCSFSGLYVARPVAGVLLVHR